MENTDLWEKYYKELEKTIEITMDDFENLSDDFEKIDRVFYLGKIEDLVTSLIFMGLFGDQMYENLFVELEQAKRKIKESMEEGEWYALFSSLCILLFIAGINWGNSCNRINSWGKRVEQGMTLAQHLWNFVAIIENYAVKENYTDNGADVEALEEIKQCAKDLIKYSHEYEIVYRHAEEVQKYIRNKLERRNKNEHDNNDWRL